MSLPWFAERFTGWIIRFGATQRPEPYDWGLPLSDTGEFAGISRTPPMTVALVREAKRVGRTLLNGKEPFWYSAPSVPDEINGASTQEKRMSKYVATLSLAPTAAQSESFSDFTWHIEDDNDLVDFQEAVSQGLIALGRKRANAANAKAS